MTDYKLRYELSLDSIKNIKKGDRNKFIDLNVNKEIYYAIEELQRCHFIKEINDNDKALFLSNLELIIKAENIFINCYALGVVRYNFLNFENNEKLQKKLISICLDNINHRFDLEMKDKDETDIEKNKKSYVLIRAWNNYCLS